MNVDSDREAEFLEFRELRNVGDIFSATLRFMRLEGKYLIVAGLAICSPFVVFALVMMLASFGVNILAIASSGLGAFDGMMNSEGTIGAGTAASSLSLAMTAIAYLTMIFSMVLLYAVGIQYCRLYMERGFGAISLREVMGAVWQNLGRMILASFLSGSLTIIGFMFFIIPGIYLTVPMSMMLVAYTMNSEQTISGAFKESFRLSKDRWMETFFSKFLVSMASGSLITIVYVAVIMLVVGVMAFDIRSTAIVLPIVLFIFALFIVLTVIGQLANVISYVLVHYSAREYHFGDAIAANLQGLDVDFDNDDEDFLSPNGIEGDLTDEAEPRTGDTSDDTERWRRGGRSDGESSSDVSRDKT